MMLKIFISIINKKYSITMIKGEYSCAMKECSNISGRVPGLRFFRFPRDPER